MKIEKISDHLFVCDETLYQIDESDSEFFSEIGNLLYCKIIRELGNKKFFVSIKGDKGIFEGEVTSHVYN